MKIKSTYPTDYRFMLDSWYPALRHSDYVVSYSVRPFSVDEAKQVLKTKPQQLSLEEMYMVAQTYEPGSREFNEVMETAVRMYPDDPTANINAACTRMESGDLEGAKRYLSKAGNSPQALHAKGVMAMLEGNTGQARQLLNQAKQAGAQGVDKTCRYSTCKTRELIEIFFNQLNFLNYEKSKIIFLRIGSADAGSLFKRGCY